jgi:hypothetical protein
LVHWLRLVYRRWLDRLGIRRLRLIGLRLIGLRLIGLRRWRLIRLAVPDGWRGVVALGWWRIVGIWADLGARKGGKS